LFDNNVLIFVSLFLLTTGISCMCAYVHAKIRVHIEKLYLKKFSDLDIIICFSMP